MKCYMIPTSHHTWTNAHTHPEVFQMGAVMNVTLPPRPPLPPSAPPLLRPSESSEDLRPGSNMSASCGFPYFHVCASGHVEKRMRPRMTQPHGKCAANQLQWKVLWGGVASSSKVNSECQCQEVTCSVQHRSTSGLEGSSADFPQGRRNGTLLTLPCLDGPFKDQNHGESWDFTALGWQRISLCHAGGI